MKNQKRLINIDRIVFGAMCALIIFSGRQNNTAFWLISALFGYFISSVMHTPDYFHTKGSDHDE